MSRVDFIPKTKFSKGRKINNSNESLEGVGTSSNVKGILP